MNISTEEELAVKEKKNFIHFLSHFFKNSRILIILFAAAIITAIPVSLWIKSPSYQVLYSQLSSEDRKSIIDQLNQMKVPYHFSKSTDQLLVPKNNVYDLRLRLAENNLPRGEGVGFELLDKQKFGISQFNEQINYQRALEGELARTIQRIKSIKSARVHIAFQKESLFLKDKKQPSASVVLDLKPGTILDSNQINAILHLISSSISDLSVNNITILDQFGELLNHPSLSYNQVNNAQFQYSEQIESLYRHRIRNILEPLVGVGNVYAQVTAQIDFNDQEKTQEKYLPNSNHENQAVRSHQTSVHNQVYKKNQKENASISDSNKVRNNQINQKNSETNKNSLVLEKNLPKNKFISSNSNINQENVVNYELNHTVSHTKMNIGEIKRLSAAVVVNFIKDKNGKLVSLTDQEINNIIHLTQEAIGYSKFRGDSVHVVNASFVKPEEKALVALDNKNENDSLYHVFFALSPWFLLILFIFFIIKKYVCSSSKKNLLDNNSIKEMKFSSEEDNFEKNSSQKNIQNDLNIDKLIHQICNISNKNPRTIALIIRQWMSDKT
ncbi:flagellar basal body M-ring protein FliF [Buchnera aphidicola (Muscaphis stroyani)]|uniref:Flagellar M-ring protein n=1 Tax=Buchnera aphidicola (Muscaphis stroyani) TaxID=1241869 RepID=A0A4D6YCF9_9GAMM|nr:flagellar basal-body MS-ring/collar protein FliF [Buchnera aphidicola]QCI24181.1 flagellar basal body M-ring protein FliF [Buchnera aphidicola (Muscaphis stroyani)]